MKTFLKVLLIGLLAGIAGAITITSFQFNTYKPRNITQKINPENLKYFQESYTDCRNNFLDKANEMKSLYKDVKISSLGIASRIDPNLTIDSCYIPAQKSFNRLLIITSATHGVEGYVGSAVQQMFLDELIKENSLDDMGVLFIHGINPYGFKYRRRVTENNVDLNRNCFASEALFESANKGYQDLASFLNPKQKVNLTSFGHFFFQVTAFQKIIKNSIGTLRQAVLQGQYRYQKGIYFGGYELEPSIKAVTPLIQETARDYDIIFTIDLHTGYGENGTLHLFPNPIKDQKKKEKIEKIFSGFSIDWSGTDDFYTVTGDFTTYVGNILPGKYYLTMVFEFGTMDTQTTMGSIKALHNVIIENQGAQIGYKSTKDEKQVKSRFLQGYYPSSQAWRSKAIEDARHFFLQVVKNYQATKI